VLAGLISDEDRRTADKVPGIGELPLVGRLFSSHRDDNQKTEIILSITPRLVRGLQRPEAAGEEFWSGTETSLRTKPLTLAPIKTALNESKTEKKDVANPAAVLPVIEKVGINWQGPKEVKTGEQFSVSLQLKSESELRSAPFQISYDPAVLEFVDVTEGDFFKRNNGKTNFTNQVDSNAGRLFVGVGRNNKEGIKGEGAVAVITFKAITAKPQTEVKLINAAPISVTGKLPEMALPAAYPISVK
jgi:general secretion pathway protein D